MEEEPRQPDSFSSCRNVSEATYYVKSMVELCIQNYMSLEVTAKYLENNHQISKIVTHKVWEQLREENPVFFSHFELRCQTDRQMRMFSDLLTKQAVWMFENGLIDISDASPSVKALLRQQHPERVHLLETLASSKTNLSSESLAFPYANGPSVAQTQNPYDQQEQVLNLTSFVMPNSNGPSVAQTQNPYDQQDQVLNLTSFVMPNPSGPSVVQTQNPYDQQDQVLNLTSFVMPNSNGPSVVQSQNPYDHQYQVLNSASFAMPNSNGPIVVQSQNPYDQQDQVLNCASVAMPNPSGPSASAPQWQIPNEQLNQYLYASSLVFPAANGISVTQLPIPYDQQEQQHQHLFTTNLPLPYANGPSVTQLPIPYNQQDQHLYTTSLPLPTTNCPSMTQLPIPNNQQDQHLYTTSLPLPTENAPSMTQLPIPNDQQDQPHQDPFAAYNDVIYNSDGEPTFEPVDADELFQFTDSEFEDLATFNLGDDIGPIGPSFLDGTDTMHFDEQQQNLIGEYQQNVHVQGSIDELLRDNFDIAPSMQTYTSVHQQQARGVVTHHHPESKALNIQDNGHIGVNGHYHPQQNVTLETLQRGVRSNGVLNGESNGQHQCVDQQQAGGVQRHYPESKALNNLDTAQHQNGHYYPQQNVTVETLQRGGRSNGVVNGESNDHQRFCNHNHSKRMCARVDKQQAGRVKRHHPESKALNNADTTGDGTETRGVKQQRSSKARATTRSMKEWEQYESEDTKH